MDVQNTPLPDSMVQAASGRAPGRVLIVDDEGLNRHLCRLILEADGLVCDEAEDGLLALEAVHRARFDVMLLDIDMPRLSGKEVLKRVREYPPYPHLRIIMFSGRVTGDDMAELMVSGADDFIGKPFSATQLRARIQGSLRLKRALDQADQLSDDLVVVNHELERNLRARDSDLVEARNALVLALAELVGYRDVETGAHLQRMQHYVRCLAAHAAALPSFAGTLTPLYVQMLECCAPLHDIGKAGVPDYVLLKPGPLTPEERKIMETHTTIGADTLQKVARRHGFARAFLHMATQITRHHHERYNGSGYPDRLGGDAIPLSARILAIGDVYDALRSRRSYKPAFTHADAVEIMKNSEGHFDPALFAIFLSHANEFDSCYSQFGE